MPETSLIRAARLLLGRCADHGVTITIATAKRKIEIVADAEDVRRASEPPADASPSWMRGLFFSDEEAAIIKALGDGELAAAVIASRIGSEPTTRLRTLLANLADRGVLVSATSGYKLADTRVLSLIPHANSTPIPSL